MKVLLFTGDKNQGKTTTLKLLYNNYFKEQASEIIEYTEEGSDLKDFSTVFCFNKKKIAINSIGDEAQYIESAFEEFSSYKFDNKELKIDLLILGHRTKIRLPNKIPIASKIPIYPNFHLIDNILNLELISKIIKKNNQILNPDNLTSEENINWNNYDKIYATKLFQTVNELLKL